MNRGEPAMRLVNAVREWNAEGRPALRVIAVHTAVDRHATFVREADESVLIGPPDAGRHGVAAGWPRRLPPSVARVAVAVRRADGTERDDPAWFTFRGGPDGVAVEDPTQRGLHPMVAERLGLWRLSPAAPGRAATMFNAVRQLGGAVGVAVLTTAIVLIGPVRLAGGHEVANLTGYRVAFLAAAAICLAAVACSLPISDADAASTIPGRGGEKTGESHPAPAPAA